MTTYTCPLCPEMYSEQTTLHVHLEVEHRKSEIVTSLIDTVVDERDSAVETEHDRIEERATPSV